MPSPARGQHNGVDADPRAGDGAAVTRSGGVSGLVFRRWCWPRVRNNWAFHPTQGGGLLPLSRGVFRCCTRWMLRPFAGERQDVTRRLSGRERGRHPWSECCFDIAAPTQRRSVGNGLLPSLAWVLGGSGGFGEVSARNQALQATAGHRVLLGLSESVSLNGRAVVPSAHCT